MPVCGAIFDVCRKYFSFFKEKFQARTCPNHHFIVKLRDIILLMSKISTSQKNTILKRLFGVLDKKEKSTVEQKEKEKAESILENKLKGL